LKPMEEQLSTVNEPDFEYTGSYTYADYLRWTIEERVELIKGRIFRMSAPTPYHQIILGNLYLQVGNFLWKKSCQLFMAPFDVRLTRKSKEDKDIINVVQPDLTVVCSRDLIDGRGCVGVPDLVVEVLSKSNNKKDLKNKYELYEEVGIREYWIVFPGEKLLNVYILGQNGRYAPPVLYAETDIMRTSILPGLEIVMADVFEDGSED
jgi:Uma2 family endonuclease